MRYTALVALLAATIVTAKDIAVSVGADGLAYTPSSVSAQPGDVITFTFAGGLHSVTQSTFASPCVKASDSAFDSGLVPGSGSATFKVTVNDSNPLWFYCRQSGHCQAGMVFAVNPTADRTFSQFQSNAKNGGAGSSSSSSAAAASTGSSSGTSSSTTVSTSSSSSSSSPSTTAVTSTSSSTGSSSSSGAAATSTGSKSSAIVNANMDIAGILALVGVVAGFVI